MADASNAERERIAAKVVSLRFWLQKGFPSIVCAPCPMAKLSWLEKEKRKLATVAKYAALRAELKKKRDYIGLSQLPRDASPVRLSRRCMATGRKRAFIGRFKLSRIAFRELASQGFIPGVTKSSW